MAVKFVHQTSCSKLACVVFSMRLLLLYLIQLIVGVLLVDIVVDALAILSMQCLRGRHHHEAIRTV